MTISTDIPPPSYDQISKHAAAESTASLKNAQGVLDTPDVLAFIGGEPVDELAGKVEGGIPIFSTSGAPLETERFEFECTCARETVHPQTCSSEFSGALADAHQREVTVLSSRGVQRTATGDVDKGARRLEVGAEEMGPRRDGGTLVLQDHGSGKEAETTETQYIERRRSDETEDSGNGLGVVAEVMQVAKSEGRQKPSQDLEFESNAQVSVARRSAVLKNLETGGEHNSRHDTDAWARIDVETVTGGGRQEQLAHLEASIVRARERIEAWLRRRRGQEVPVDTVAMLTPAGKR